MNNGIRKKCLISFFLMVMIMMNLWSIIMFINDSVM